MIFDGPPAELTASPDVRVRQFALGQAGPETLDAATVKDVRKNGDWLRVFEVPVPFSERNERIVP